MSGILILISSAACGKNAEIKNNTDSAGTTAAEEVIEEEKEQDYISSLGSLDMQGQTIRLIGFQSAPRVSFPEDNETGEPINDALFKRDLELKERFGIDFQYIKFDDPYNVLGAVDKAVTAASDEYDIIFASMNPTAAALVTKGELLSYDNIPYVDLSQKWWSSYNDTVQIIGKQYIPSGIITPFYYTALYITLYNKRLADNCGIEDLSRLVLDGMWTVDKQAAMMSGVTSDIDGDGKLGKDDLWALVYDDVAGFGYYIGAGQKMTEFDSDGIPYLAMDSEASVSIITRLAAAFGDRSSALRGEDYAKNTEIEIFSDGRALFNATTFVWIPWRYRSMDDDYGVLPMPMLEEAQGQYFSYSQPWEARSVCVPVTNTKLDVTGLVIEAMACLSDDYIRNAAYETTFKTKLTRDSESAQILDIVANASTYDLNVLFNWGGTAGILRESVLGKYSDFMSKYEKQREKAQAEIDALIATISE